MKEDKKKHILNVAIKLFKLNGIQNTSVDAIVKKAAIAKGSFFYHFEKKDNLIFDIIEMEFEN